MGKFTISMAIFNSYVTNYQRVCGVLGAEEPSCFNPHWWHPHFRWTSVNLQWESPIYQLSSWIFYVNNIYPPVKYSNHQQLRYTNYTWILSPIKYTNYQRWNEQYYASTWTINNLLSWFSQLQKLHYVGDVPASHVWLSGVSSSSMFFI